MLRPQNTDYRTYKTTLKVQVKCNYYASNPVYIYIYIYMYMYMYMCMYMYILLVMDESCIRNKKSVDHEVLFDILQHRFAVSTETTLQWFRSYLSGRTQVFCSNRVHFATYTLDSSVPQGSVLGPIKFITYTEDIAELFQQNCNNNNCYCYSRQLQLLVTLTLLTTLLYNFISQLNDS